MQAEVRVVRQTKYTFVVYDEKYSYQLQRCSSMCRANNYNDTIHQNGYDICPVDIKKVPSGGVVKTIQNYLRGRMNSVIVAKGVLRQS